MVATFLPLASSRADVVDSGGAGGVEHAVGVQRQDGVDVGGRRDADRVPADERADVHTVLVVGVHPRADELQVVAVVEDRGDHFLPDRACPPLNHPIHASDRSRIAGVTNRVQELLGVEFPVVRAAGQGRPAAGA